MQFITATVLAALAFAAPSVQTRLAHVYNQCPFDVNVWSVSAGDAGQKIVIPANGGQYSETYKIPTAGGVSLKLTPEHTKANPVPVTQFEYTLEGGFIWYDISDIDCVESSCPFKEYGMYMHSAKGCPAVSCEKGRKCAGAYNIASDNFATRACPENNDIHLYLCATSAPDGTSAPLVKRVSRTFAHALRKAADSIDA
jgi:hypothetical protein